MEIENDGVGFPARGAWVLAEVFGQEQEVAPAKGPGTDRSPPRRVDPPRPAPIGRADAVTVRAHQFAVRDLGFDPFKTVALPNESPDFGPLRTNVVEFENRGISEAAVRASAALEDVEDMSSRRRSPLFERLLRLTPVEVAAKPHVLASAVLAPGLSSVKV